MLKVGTIKINEQNLAFMLLIGAAFIFAAKKTVDVVADVVDENLIDPLASFIAAPFLHYWEQVQLDAENDRDFAVDKLGESIAAARARGEEIPPDILARYESLR